MLELQENFSEVYTCYDNARDNLKFYNRHVKTLEAHITQGVAYLEHKDIYVEYKALKPRK